MIYMHSISALLPKMRQKFILKFQHDFKINFPIPSPVPCYNACCLAYFAGNRPIGAKINFDLRTVITTSVFSSIIKHIRVLLFGFVGNGVMGKANHEVTQL